MADVGYMAMVMILKRFIHAERAGLWEEHLVEIEKILTYLVAAGQYKYVSGLLHYLQAMRNISTISQQSTTMEKYLQQTKVMVDLNPDDPKHSLDPNSQPVKMAAGTEK